METLPLYVKCPKGITRSQLRKLSRRLERKGYRPFEKPKDHSKVRTLMLFMFHSSITLEHEVESYEEDLEGLFRLLRS